MAESDFRSRDAQDLTLTLEVGETQDLRHDMTLEQHKIYPSSETTAHKIYTSPETTAADCTNCRPSPEFPLSLLRKRETWMLELSDCVVWQQAMWEGPRAWAEARPADSFRDRPCEVLTNMVSREQFRNTGVIKVIKATVTWGIITESLIHSSDIVFLFYHSE